MTLAEAQGPASGRRRRGRALALVMGLTAAMAVGEIVGGVLTGSLALIADAGHMVSDVLALSLALGAVWLAGRPPTPLRSFGYRRAEVLAALVNGLTLGGIAVWIFVEAARRFTEPAEILGGGMLVVAVVGLIVNGVSITILRRAPGANLNLRAAMLHVQADLLGSLGAIAASLIIITTGWVMADAIVSILIGVLILLSGWSVVRDAVWILLEAAPRGVDPPAVAQALRNATGVTGVHDLHIWTIASGFPALSAHVVAARNSNCDELRRELVTLLADGYGIDHTTLQVEAAHGAAGGAMGCGAEPCEGQIDPAT